MSNCLVSSAPCFAEGCSSKEAEVEPEPDPEGVGGSMVDEEVSGPELCSDKMWLKIVAWLDAPRYPGFG